MRRSLCASCPSDSAPGTGAQARQTEGPVPWRPAAQHTCSAERRTACSEAVTGPEGGALRALAFTYTPHGCTSTHVLREELLELGVLQRLRRCAFGCGHQHLVNVHQQPKLLRVTHRHTVRASVAGVSTAQRGWGECQAGRVQAQSTQCSSLPPPSPHGGPPLAPRDPVHGKPQGSRL